ncbi:MAG: DUF2909 domain-containing protein [Porticoccaceae bacterium]
MLLKTIIVVLFIAVVISLFSGLRFLVSDLGNSRRRLLISLGIRVTLAAMLLTAIVYGVYTGQLSSKAPWDRQLHPDATTTVPRPDATIETTEDPLKQG